jgi:ABC-type sulfate transport system permease component
MIDKALFGIFLLILILFWIWKKGKKSQNLALFLVLASNNRIPEAQSPEISLFVRILALIVIFLMFLLCAWYLSGKGQGEY